MRIAVYGRKLHPSAASHVRRIFDEMSEHGMESIVYAPFARHLRNHLGVDVPDATFTRRHEVRGQIDAVISMGGDGTMLDTITWAGPENIPVMGVNFGRLGFLASISPDEIPQAIRALDQGSSVIDERIMLQLESNKPIFDRSSFALNEVTIQRLDTSSMITVHAYLNGQLLNSYWADGIIVATPTGSTGYSLSCGGPVIYPTSDNFIITPIAPHNLNVRPMVLSNDVVLSFAVEGRGDQFLVSLDSRAEKIDQSYELAVRQAPYKARLLRLNDGDFLNAIREKLLWGHDQRN